MDYTVAIIFGGAGYIGSNLARHFLSESMFDKIYVFDIRPLHGFDKERNEGSVIYMKVDVRNNIDVAIESLNNVKSWIYNLAAIHREPGHEYQEYFDTNISGAKNVTNFARKIGVNNIYFTSSIAPYGRSLSSCTEANELYPETAYGISKAMAEQIHQIWMSEDDRRRLIISRPSVIFGPKDPGNVYRMIRSLQAGTFILPDGGNIVKAYGYIFGLIESVCFTMRKEDKLIVYNYAEYPLVPLKEMVNISKRTLKINRPTIKLPKIILVIMARIIYSLNRLLGKKTDIHPVRVKKAAFPTNIVPKYLIDEGFNFKFQFESALRHWRSVAPEDFEH